jgi:altronate dehydratase small subunit
MRMVIKMAEKTQDAIIISDKDNVATALKDLAKGTKVLARGDILTMEVNLKDDIAFGHKFALYDILSGSDIIKYGAVIGRATQDIKKGEHAHLHNIEGARGRGDKK